MDWRILEPIVTKIPTVKRSTGHQPLKRKLLWTIAVLVTYFILTNVILLGLAESGGTDAFGQFRSILAGSQGSVLQLGIGPIVTGSIIVQLLTGTGIIEFDQSDPRDQALYQGLQKFLVITMVVMTSIPMVFASGFLPTDPQLAQQLTVPGVQLLLFAQIVIGGLLIMYMDEIVSQWGIGSGVGLFIIAGISQRLIGGVLTSIIPSWVGIATGEIQIKVFGGNGLQQLILGEGHLLAILTTAIIFTIVVYAESTRVEIPLGHSSHKTGGARYPIKLIYASVLPLIFVRAIQAQLQFLGQALTSSFNLPQWVGVYGANGQAISGLFYYLSPIQRPQDWMWFTAGTSADPLDIGIRLFVDAIFMIGGGAIFAIFWIRTSGMDAESVAENIMQSQMQIPGFRRNASTIEQVLKRYIPYVTIVGGALLGALALFASLLGTIGGVTGTGLLLTVSITYKMYEEVANEWMREKIPAPFRNLL
jgi:preprotein translocase subunit SecY